MMDSTLLEILNTRLLTLELIVSELHETLIDKGLIDKDEFNDSLNDKIKNLSEVVSSLKKESDTKVDIPTMFGGPIGEA